MDGLRNRKYSEKKSEVNTAGYCCKKSDEKIITANNNKHNNGEIKTKNKTENTCTSRNNEDTPSSSRSRKLFRINFELDLLSMSLFIGALLTRMYKLEEPNNIV